MEPAAEATFHGNSYGFGPGRSCHDVQKRLFLALSTRGKGINKTILEMDIEKCFDQISHQIILDRVELPKVAIKGLRRAIIAGVKGEFPRSEMGTPQGGVISPLLANIALNGIKTIGENKGVSCLRYADDLVYICKPGTNPEHVKSQVSQFLEKRGLRIKENKTRIVKSTDGFDFLGWHFAVKPNGKFISTPTKEATKRVKAKVKATMKDSRFPLTQRLAKCGSIVRGWRT